MNDFRESLLELPRRRSEVLKTQAREGLLQALAERLERLKENDQDPEAYIAVAKGHARVSQDEEAIAILEQGLRRCSPSLNLWQRYVKTLEHYNQTERAIEAAHEARRHFPEDVFLRLKEALLLPVIYETEGQLTEYRRRFANNLPKVCRGISLDTPEARFSALAGVGFHINFYLGYQARDDRELQVEYGKLVHRVMEANYPQWVQPIPMPPSGEGKIRVGYLTSRFIDVSVTKNHLEWLRRQDRDQFSVYAYHLGVPTDPITEEVKRLSHFRSFPNDVEKMARAILADQLHILVFLDIGTNPHMTELAALRLAPVQSMTWAVPITSGLGTVDYFLSSELMEPEGAQAHYSEELVCLPGVGVCHRKPVIPTIFLTKTRIDFGLREDAVVYLSCQSLFKYLPGQDMLFAQIAKRIPNSQFVFLAVNRLAGRDFQSRLSRSFATAGLDASDYCVVLPPQAGFDYWNLNRVSDVFLDTTGWSGGVTTFEAIACGLPVVTLPGKLMRGRHSYAILTQAGVTDTIAGTPEEYVEIAVRLGLDRPWRDNVLERMARGCTALFWDARSVGALEDFFRRVVKERQ